MMVQAVCVDGPRDGAVVWVPEGSVEWSVAGLVGYAHYRLSGTMNDARHGQVARLEYVGRSRSRSLREQPVVRVPQQRVPTGQVAPA